jgi:hypothetical protein
MRNNACLLHCKRHQLKLKVFLHGRESTDFAPSEQNVNSCNSYLQKHKNRECFVYVAI